MSDEAIDPRDYRDGQYSPNNWPANQGPNGQWTPYGRGYLPPPPEQQGEIRERIAERDAYHQELVGLTSWERALVVQVDSSIGFLPSDVQSMWDDVRPAIVHKGDARKLRAAADAWSGILADGSDAARFSDGAGSLAGRVLRAQRDVGDVTDEMLARWTGDAADGIGSYVANLLDPRFTELRARAELVAKILLALADAMEELHSALRGAADRFSIGLAVGVVGGFITGPAGRASSAATLAILVWGMYEYVTAYLEFLDTCDQRMRRVLGGDGQVMSGSAWPRLSRADALDLGDRGAWVPET